ncbi:double-strand break repair helicase AddA [Phenylobacterium sp.]|uniref:double-strand break repair helicase AddA n=1 Tax=Phenylobacterium sp. TaxID=1871053 RepID=UPI002DEB0338|nr:double-strand break repair helicase AddA [Phenylobacterium sp.]
MSLTEAPTPTRAADRRDPQARAADPTLSVFVTANAGSGKTKTLIDRVARLLLAGAAPETILCVTYTKAAAAEMQRRLYEQLGDWSVMAGETLAERLTALVGQPIDPRDEARLSEARALFARALETPGGLKIQTIHAFCEKLLRRFPLEAGVSPGFRVMDDAASAAVAAAARRDVARHAMAPLLGKEGGEVAEAYARMSIALDFQAFEAMFGAFEARRGALAGFFQREGGLAGARAWVWTACGFDAPTTVAALAQDGAARIRRDQWRAAAEVADAGGKRDQTYAARLRAVADDPDAPIETAFAAMFTDGGDGKEADWFAATRCFDAHPALRAYLLSEQARLDELREYIRAAQVAEDSAHALALAAAYLEAYRIEKRFAGALDFTDLIEKACHLLRDSAAAQWVLYKLDGGIDHILLDEAQDTAPDQWRIVDALTDEFFAGAGRARTGQLARNLFVVGDEKQSIYSFQGAQADLLIKQFEAHLARAAGARRELHRVDLLTSWRSTPEVLSFVDAVFAPAELSAAIQPRPQPEPVRHEVAPYRAAHAGCVDVWPLEAEPEVPERRAWDAPLDARPEDSATRTLARKIACEIRDLIARGDGVYDKDLKDWRPAKPGDVLILVRRRRALFEEILRALKQENIPVAGADRLALSEHIVFDDLLGLARFALFPGDELTLSALLRSPFCDVSDDSLYDLAHGRKHEPLWDRLQRRAGEQPEWGAATAFLSAVIAEAATRRPFEFYGRVMGLTDAAGRSMRARLLRRLGAEAQDALDEFLAQVMAAEARGVHDLERLAFDFAGLSITVKREMEAARDEVRVMTAHGAKGLEAPIVILPETTLSQAARGSPLMETEDGGFLWCGAKDRDCEPSAAARARRAKREEDEAYRLLYVALTRARDRLILCGRLPKRADEAKLKGWWGAVRDALGHDGVAPRVRTVACGGMEILRYGPDPTGRLAAPASAAATVGLPAWTREAAPAETFGRYASPSDLGEGARVAAPSPLAASGGLGRFRRGDLIHKLLQLLPDLPADRRAPGAQALLGRERDLTEAQASEMAAAALSVLEDPRFAEVFGEGSRAEVAIAGSAAALPAGLKVSGRIDRLVVLPDRVLVADFKTNRPSPATIEAADPAYLRQMAIYWAVLAEVFPGRRIEAALIWTDGPKLMPVPENLIRQSLAGLGASG